MAQLKELLEKEELEQIKEVKKEIREENSQQKEHFQEATVKEGPTGNVSIKENSANEKRSNAWIWVAAIVAAVIILR